MTRCVSYLRRPREKQPTMTEADASFSLALIHQPSKCGRFLVGGPRGWKGWSAVVYVASSSGSFILWGCTALHTALLQMSLHRSFLALPPQKTCTVMRCTIVTRHKCMHVSKHSKNKSTNRASGLYFR